MLSLCVCFCTLLAVGHAARLPLVIGGGEAPVGAYPWMTSLENYGGHWCGSSLIGDRWVLTAAHCILSGITPSGVTVGMHDQYWTQGQPKRYGVKKVFVHPMHWVGSGHEPNDLALVELTSTVETSEFVKPIKLAEPDSSYHGWVGVVTGWGNTAPWSNAGNNMYLQEAPMQVFYDSYCTSRWGNSFRTDIMICLGYNYEKMSCNGDSGGPFAVMEPNGEWRLVGVVSWGVLGCDPEYYPAVYSKVSSFRGWINEVTGL